MTATIGNLQIANGGQFNNLAGATYDVEGASGIAFGAASGTFVQPGKPSAVRSLLGAELRRRLNRPARVAAVGVSVVAVLAVVKRLVRRATGS